VIPLFHRDFGTPGRPPLTLLHGLLGSSRNWQMAGRELATGYHACALDLRNHGRSPHAAATSYAELAGDVLGWLDAQGIEKTTLLGHSLGGKVAMWLACHHPERVERLVVVDIAPRDYRSHAHRTEFAAMHALRLETLRSRAEAERHFVDAGVADEAMGKFLVTNLECADDGCWRWMINLPALTEALPTLLGDSLGADDRYAGPALWIVGGRSDYVRADDAARITGHFPCARIERIADSGHNPHIDARAEFVCLVRGLL